MTDRVIWPQDWNRPLSLEELRIGQRLETAPDHGMEAFLFERPSRIPSPRTKRVSGGRRGKDVGRSAGRAKARAKR